MERELAECTFKPRISKGSETTSFKSKQNIWDRLHGEREGVQLLRDEIKRQKDREHCTFQPTVSEASRTIASTVSSSVFDRLANTERVSSVAELRES